jgi:hypothetical protein
MTKINTLYISFTDRNARRRGPTSSEAWNDIHDELAADLAGLYDQWNNRLKPLTTTLPDGTVDSDIDAFTNGLDGQTLYTKSDSTVSDTTYYNSVYTRPNTVYEQFVDVYSELESLETTLSSQISGQVFSAANITIVDNGSLYDATNVETALAEVKELVDDLATGSTYLPVSGGTLTGQIACQIPSPMVPTGINQEIDWNASNVQVLDLGSASGDVTVTFVNAAEGSSFLLKVIQGSPNRDITWPASVLFEGGVTPVITTTDDVIDIFSFIYDGTNYLCTYSQDLQ